MSPRYLQINLAALEGDAAPPPPSIPRWAMLAANLGTAPDAAARGCP
jgi:hypothetical protein